MKIAVRVVLVLVVIIAVLLGALLLAKDWLVRQAVAAAIHKATGFEARIESLQVGLLGRTVDLRGFSLRNPPDFPEGSAFDVNRLFLRVDYATLQKDVVHIPELVVDIPRVVVVRKDTGETNMERIQKAVKPAGTATRPPPSTPPQPSPPGRPAPESPGPAPSPEAPPAPAPAPAPPPAPPRMEKKVHIDKLTVKLGQVENRDYKKGGGAPQVTTIALDVDRTFDNVEDLEQVGQLIAAEVVGKTLGRMLNDLANPSGQGATDVNQAVEQLGKQLNRLLKKK